jgi:hypothetical protein
MCFGQVLQNHHTWFEEITTRGERSVDTLLLKLLQEIIKENFLLVDLDCFGELDHHRVGT